MEIQISKDTIKKEFERIKQGSDNAFSTLSSWNEIVLYFQWKEFYKQEIKLWEENKLYKGLPLQSYIYLNRLKYVGKGYGQLTDREILRAFKISGIHIGNSFHSPFYIQQFIKDYNIKSIYDCCGGWGHRLLGAWNIKYIYNDINPITNTNCRKICEYFKLKGKYFYQEDSSKFTPNEDYEAVFTCPPYFDVEIYSELGAENLTYDEFLAWWNNTIICSCINKSTCKYFAFIINHTYKQNMEQICINNNLTKINEIQLGTINNLNHFQRNKPNSLKGEYLLIFSK